MLKAETYEEACSARHAVDGKRCSRQAFGTLPIIREVDAHMTSELQRRVREGHPEVSFTALAGAPMAFRKLSQEGRKERLQALRANFGDLGHQLEGLRTPGAVTDAIDAYAMLFTARRSRDGCAETLPPHPERDIRGLRMEIVY
jgi:predicted RNase H-like nuclease